MTLMIEIAWVSKWILAGVSQYVTSKTMTVSDCDWPTHTRDTLTQWQDFRNSTIWSMNATDRQSGLKYSIDSWLRRKFPQVSPTDLCRWTRILSSDHRGEKWLIHLCSYAKPTDGNGSGRSPKTDEAHSPVLATPLHSVLVASHGAVAK